MQTVYVRKVVGNECFIPLRLRDFLIALEATDTSEEIWNLLVDLCTGINLPIVDYVCATDYRRWEKAQFIRTTFHSDWIRKARADPSIRKLSYFRTHAVQYLTPITVGLAYVDEMANVRADRLEIMRVTSKMGLNAGFAVPLRMNEPGQAAILVMGGPQSRAEFDPILAEHGWTMHAAALSAHTRYSELFKAEFVERNHLTVKQQELVRLVGRGLLDKEIAHELGISFSAVRQRLAAVQAKTGVLNRAELAALAMRVGLIADPTLKPHAAELTVFLSTGDGKTGSEAEHHYPQAAQ